MDKRVSALAVDDYDVGLLTEIVERHFGALGLWDDLRPGMTVLLKPNLLARFAPEAAVTTHPAVVEAVAIVLQNHGITDITLADSSGGPYTRGFLEGVYRASGLYSAAGRTGIRLNTDVSSAERSCTPDAALCRSLRLITPVLRADCVINLPKLKTHGMMMMTGAVKNLFGCVPGLEKPQMHLRFPEKARFARMLLDLALLVRPVITLVDAVEAMEGDGPSGGTVRHAGMTFAGRDMFTLDLALAEFIGFRPDEVPTVAEAARAGLCPESAAQLEWLLDGRPEPVARYRHPHSKPVSFSGHVPGLFRPAVRWVERNLSPRPAVSQKRCVGCGKCAESCAPGAMTIRGRKACLDLTKCIRCYCCHEMCPVRAIRIRKLFK